MHAKLQRPGRAPEWALHVDRKMVNDMYKYHEYGPRSKARRHKHVKALRAEVLRLLGENLEGMHVGPLTQLAQAAVPGHPNGLVRAVLLDLQYTREITVEWPTHLFAPLYKLSFEAWVQNIEVTS